MFRFSLSGASKYGFDTCRHFAQREGFGYVVVRSQVETGHGVIFRIFGINEVILALSTTMEGDTTNFYIYRKLEKLGVKLSVIARGISIGDELEYTDEVTLGRSIVNRTPFSGTA